MPVLLTPIVTSPAFRAPPCLIVSRLGSDSETQSSWAGLVKTPMLGLLRVVVVDMANTNRRTRVLDAWVNSMNRGFGRSLLLLSEMRYERETREGKENGFLEQERKRNLSCSQLLSVALSTMHLVFQFFL